MSAALYGAPSDSPIRREYEPGRQRGGPRLGALDLRQEGTLGRLVAVAYF